MKITSKKQKEEFKPIEVTIRVETKQELNVLKDMCLANVSVPNAVIEYRDKALKEEEITTRSVLNLFLEDLLNSLDVPGFEVSKNTES